MSQQEIFQSKFGKKSPTTSPTTRISNIQYDSNLYILIHYVISPTLNLAKFFKNHPRNNLELKNTAKFQEITANFRKNYREIVANLSNFTAKSLRFSKFSPRI